MHRTHRRPLVAYGLVSAACALVLVQPQAGVLAGGQGTAPSVRILTDESLDDALHWLTPGQAFGPAAPILTAERPDDHVDADGGTVVAAELSTSGGLTGAGASSADGDGGGQPGGKSGESLDAGLTVDGTGGSLEGPGSGDGDEDGPAPGADAGSGSAHHDGVLTGDGGLPADGLDFVPSAGGLFSPSDGGDGDGDCEGDDARDRVKADEPDGDCDGELEEGPLPHQFGQDPEEGHPYDTAEPPVEEPDPGEPTDPAEEQEPIEEPDPAEEPDPDEPTGESAAQPAPVEAAGDPTEATGPEVEAEAGAEAGAEGGTVADAEADVDGDAEAIADVNEPEPGRDRERARDRATD